MKFESVQVNLDPFEVCLHIVSDTDEIFNHRHQLLTETYQTCDLYLVFLQLSGIQAYMQGCYGIDILKFGGYRSVFDKIPWYRYRFYAFVIHTKKDNQHQKGWKQQNLLHTKTPNDNMLEIAKFKAQKSSKLLNESMSYLKIHLFQKR